jgi:hypothetical protein
MALCVYILSLPRKRKKGKNDETHMVVEAQDQYLTQQEEVTTTTKN